MTRPATFSVMTYAVLSTVLLCLAAPRLFARPEAGGDVVCVQGLQNDSLVCVGTHGSGIYRSIDGGEHWIQTNMREGLVPVILPDPRSEDHLYAGSSLGLLASTDKGLHWWTLDASIRPLALAAAFDGPRLLLAADGSIVRRTADDGKSWSTIERLTPYAIRFLVSMPTDSGALFIAASDSTVLSSTEQAIGQWTELPALPHPGTSVPRITVVIVDTLSITGTRLAVGTSAGVFVYSFHTRRWEQLNAGLPVGDIGALGIIVYDTTAASRSYSYCASIRRNTANPAAASRVYKLSSLSGSIVAGSVWNPIANEQVDVRFCFMPNRGVNRAKIYLATNDGLRISYDDGTTWAKKIFDLTPIAVLGAESYNAGLVNAGGSMQLLIRIVNHGEKALTLSALALRDAENFSLETTTDPLVIAPLDGVDIPVQFAPAGAGKFSTRVSCTTNDPLRPTISVAVTGYCAGRAIGYRTIAIDRAHGGAGADTTFYAELANAFRLSGMSVIESFAGASEAGLAMVVLPAPTRTFTSAECAALAADAASGTTIVALANSADSSVAVLNALFAMPQWTTAAQQAVTVRYRTDHPASVTGIVQAVKSFSLRNASYLAHVDTLVCTNPAALLITGSASDTLCTAPASTVVLGTSTRIGAGKIIALGDARIWSTLTSNGTATGLWAADNFSAALSIAGTVVTAAVRFPTVSWAEHYRLFSVPYTLEDNSIASVLADFGAPDPYAWRLFGAWNETTQSYAEYPSPSLTTIERGKGYWLSSRGEHQLKLGTVDFSCIPEAFTMTLKPGFTLIGNPFPFAIDWQTALKPDAVENHVWKFDGTEFLSTTLMGPYEGYFVNNASDTDAIVTVRPIQAVWVIDKISRASSVAAAEGEWTMRAAVTDGVVSDTENFFGMLRFAAGARDANDFAEPPLSPGRSVQLSFVAANGGALAGDYRPVASDGAYWDCQVRASASGAHLTLSLGAENQLPAGYGIYILDRTTERVSDCTQSAAYALSLGSAETVRSLRILAGTQQYIEQHTDGVPLTPLDYTLEQNFPNPWNPSTTIRYTCAHSGMVDLEIFNVLGQHVKQLTHAFQKIGVYSEQWDGRNDAGVNVSSGVYFYRLRTDAFVQSKRMVLVR